MPNHMGTNGHDNGTSTSSLSNNAINLHVLSGLALSEPSDDILREHLIKY